MTGQADVIVPVFNERANLPAFRARLEALPCYEQLQLIVVDNGSTDGSVDYLAQWPGITLIRHTHNEGYGASLRDGLAAARHDQVIIIDADGEYPPEAIPALLNALQQHAVVYASRLLHKPSARAAGMPAFKWWGNRCISGLFNQLFGQRTTDLYTGCKALRRDCLAGLVLERNGFEQVLELAVQLSLRGIRIAEIPVDFQPRAAGESKMSHLTETLKYLFWLLRYRLRLGRGRVVA